MAARRAERLVNLVICLLSTRQFLTAERIRAAVPGYEPADADPRTDDAFKRMFERDKAELRDLGIPLETGRNSIFDAEDGYRITRRSYELPPVEFEPAEAAAVGLAARLWQSATLGTPARSALIKLRAGGTDVEASATPGALPHIDASDPALPSLLDAAGTARVARFAYRKSGDDAPQRRTVEPWGVLSWRRRWYVAGFDQDRQDARSFRLSRIVGPVDVAGPAGAFARPPGIDLVALVAGRRSDATRTARVQITGPGAGRLRRVADSERDGVLIVSFSDLHAAARLIAAAGTSARVLDPPDLVDAVVEELSAAVEGVPGVIAGGALMTGERERLPRLLALVPYLQAHDGVAIRQVAADFGVGEEQIRRDLRLLWMCGLPGHGPGDLIDLSFDGDTVSVIFDAGISRPLRLTGEEALALVVALRTLAETPGRTDRDAVERALAKVEAAAGGSVAAAAVTVSLDTVTRLLPVLQEAVDTGHALTLRYYTATRDETTERVVDPMRIFDLDGRSYLEAWCRSAEGMRVFRVDRIDRADILDEPAAPPPEARLRDLSEGVYTPAAEHLLVVLAVDPAYWWMADYYAVDDDEQDDEGTRQISLRVADPAWVTALALGSRGQVRVLSPVWLAEAIRAEAASALAAYRVPAK